MGRFILLPFAVHPDVPELPTVVLPLAPIPVTPSTVLATREDVIRLYRLYLGRDPEDEGAIAGRVGRPLFDVELEIATSEEAFNRAIGATPLPSPTPVPSHPSGLSAWDQRAGLLIADALARELGMTAAPSGAWIVFAVQAGREDAHGTSEGARANNPLNLSDARGAIHWPGVVGRYAAEGTTYPVFESLEAGAAASATNYTATNYAAVVRAFRSGDLLELAAAIQASPWAANHYGGTFVDDVRRALTPTP